MESSVNSQGAFVDYPPLHCSLKDEAKRRKDQTLSMDDLQGLKTIYRAYVELGFKPIRCKGCHHRYNPKQDYRIAKEPVDKRFTANTYVAPSLFEIEQWEHEQGWTGWLIPKDYMALDVEDSGSIKYLEEYFIATGVKPLVHKTNNGKHYFFKMKGNLPATTKVHTKLGVTVTYRIGGKNYLIMAPINGRRWEL